MYLVKAPSLLKKIYPKKLVWSIPADDSIYLTFDDGPHPTATQFVLQMLAQYKAKATFFCIGKNVIEYPEIYQQIIAEGHTVGNHTQNHSNGWNLNKEEYLADIAIAAKHINTNLFRPPYGRIRKKQAEAIHKMGLKIIMWDVLSGDFDPKISPEKCWENIKQNIEPGSIIVFHDSSKAWDRMAYALPRTLAYCQEQKWQMKSLY